MCQIWNIILQYFFFIWKDFVLNCLDAKYFIIIFSNINERYLIWYTKWQQFSYLLQLDYLHITFFFWSKVIFWIVWMLNKCLDFVEISDVMISLWIFFLLCLFYPVWCEYAFTLQLLNTEHGGNYEYQHVVRYSFPWMIEWNISWQKHSRKIS